MTAKKAAQNGAQPLKGVHTPERRHEAVRSRLRHDPSLSKLAYGSKFIMGHGNLDADVAFVVEQPSPEDIATGRYMAGREKPVLNHMLLCLDLRLKDVYLTGLSKWNVHREFTQAEADRLYRYLNVELRIVRPKAVILLGRGLTEIVVPEFDIANELGSEVQCQNYSLYPMFHPATALVNVNARNAMASAMSRIAVTF